MKLYESSEDYLETILILTQRNGTVHAVDIAREMEFTKPSVSIAMHKLEDNGYIAIKKNGEIILTEEGYQIASAVYERHLVLTEALIAIGVSEEQAMIDACKVEHDISKETFDAIKKVLKK
ncbi:MAG: metal-dependent transcriptional regulator [Bacilli bacterium]|nr:metal-dependent transcriptional regulator [Bacilli bacterium]